MVKYLSFHHFFFCLKIVFDVNGKGPSVTRPLFLLMGEVNARTIKRKKSLFWNIIHYCMEYQLIGRFLNQQPILIAHSTKIMLTSFFSLTAHLPIQ
jgi:hypothetical protein